MEFFLEVRLFSENKQKKESALLIRALSSFLLLLDVK